MRITKTLIIGSGPAGCTAAIYAARAGLKPIMLEGHSPGGQLMITNEVENYPPFASTTGPGLMAEMRGHAADAGAEIMARNAEQLTKDRETGHFHIILDDGSELRAETVILASGAQAKWLGLPSEEAFMGRGVSACATCDGFFYRGRDVIVVGGGNTAIEEALYLSNLAAHVTVVHRKATFKAERILQDRLHAKANISVIWNATVDEILGDSVGVTGVRLSTNDGHRDLKAHGVFIAIGHAPQAGLVSGIADTDENGYVIVTPGTTKSSVPGFFAAGDVADPHYRQAITSAGMGCMAALDAERYLSLRESYPG